MLVIAIVLVTVVVALMVGLVRFAQAGISSGRPVTRLGRAYRAEQARAQAHRVGEVTGRVTTETDAEPRGGLDRTAA